jgi:hypothetical protein
MRTCPELGVGGPQSGSFPDEQPPCDWPHTNRFKRRNPAATTVRTSYTTVHCGMITLYGRACGGRVVLRTSERRFPFPSHVPGSPGSYAMPPACSGRRRAVFGLSQRKNMPYRKVLYGIVQLCASLTLRLFSLSPHCFAPPQWGPAPSLFRSPSP